MTEGATIYTGVGKAWGPGRGEKALQAALDDVSAKCDLSEIKTHAVIIADDYINMFEMYDLYKRIKERMHGGEHDIFAGTSWLGFGDDVIEITIIATEKTEGDCHA